MSNQATKRLAREYKEMLESPTPYIMARPMPENILEFHYIITGPPDTPYAGGQYHGTFVFPPNYPFAAPRITMITPSGRFVPNTRLCFSFSDYHPESWNCSWTVENMLVGVLSFFTGDEMTTGSMRSTDQQKMTLAAQSRRWNAKHNKRFLAVFPDFVDGATMESLATNVLATTKHADVEIGVPRAVINRDVEIKRKHSVDNMLIDKKAKNETINIDSDGDENLGTAHGPIVIDADDDYYFFNDCGESSGEDYSDDEVEEREVIVID